MGSIRVKLYGIFTSGSEDVIFKQNPTFFSSKVNNFFKKARKVILILIK